MPLFVNMTDPDARYCLHCPTCLKRYGMSVFSVTTEKDQVSITYYCTDCHGPSTLVVTEHDIRWEKHEAERALAERAVAHGH